MTRATLQIMPSRDAISRIIIFLGRYSALLLGGIIYNPWLYWMLRGLVYKRECDLKPGDRNLRRIISILHAYNFDSFLDVGCGYGRYLKGIEDAYAPLIRIAGCDISATQLCQAEKYLGAHSKVQLSQSDGDPLPYQDNTFNMTMTYGVCIHVPPDSIMQFIREILRVTKHRYLCIESSTGKSRGYYFSHDYPAIFRALGVSIHQLEEQLDGTKIYITKDLGRI